MGGVSGDPDLSPGVLAHATVPPGREVRPLRRLAVVDRLCTSSAEGGGRVRTADKAVPMALRRKRWGMGLSRNRFRRLRDAHGLTVVDLVIGVAVIAIMAAIAVPNLQPLLLRYRLNGATRQVMSDLMAARMKAVSQHRSFRIFFTMVLFTIMG
jgi:hypothetical protein